MFWPTRQQEASSEENKFAAIARGASCRVKKPWLMPYRSKWARRKPVPSWVTQQDSFVGLWNCLANSEETLPLALPAVQPPVPVVLFLLCCNNYFFITFIVNVLPHMAQHVYGGRGQLALPCPCVVSGIKFWSLTASPLLNHFNGGFVTTEQGFSV